jgi:hypothetical protein
VLFRSAADDAAALRALLCEFVNILAGRLQIAAATEEEPTEVGLPDTADGPPPEAGDAYAFVSNAIGFRIHLKSAAHDAAQRTA